VAFFAALLYRGSKKKPQGYGSGVEQDRTWKLDERRYLPSHDGGGGRYARSREVQSHGCESEYTGEYGVQSTTVKCISGRVPMATHSLLLHIIWRDVCSDDICASLEPPTMRRGSSWVSNTTTTTHRSGQRKITFATKDP